MCVERCAYIIHTIDGASIKGIGDGLLNGENSDNKGEQGVAHICMRKGEKKEENDLNFSPANTWTYLYEIMTGSCGHLGGSCFGVSILGRGPSAHLFKTGGLAGHLGVGHQHSHRLAIE